MSPNSISSPLSISSPYSAHSSLSNASNIGQTLASSFATSVTSGGSVHSPKSENDVLLELGVGNEEMQVRMAPLSAAAAAAAMAASKKHKPHGCDVCGASFARKVHLQRHSLRHQVCKPYCCERCGKCFSRQDSLVRHHRLLHEKVKEKPKRSVGTVTKKKKDVINCTRCSNIGAKCDGKTPCNRCSSSEYNAQQCNYRAASSSTSDKRHERRQSMSQVTTLSTSSVFDDEESLGEEDMMSIGEETHPSEMFSSFGNGHGPRRYTVSNMETVASSMQNDLHGAFPRTFDDCFYQTASNWSTQVQHHPHPFEMPQLDSMSFLDVKSLHPQQLHQGPMISHPHEQSLFDGHQTLSPPTSQAELDVPLLTLFNNISSDGTQDTPSATAAIANSSISFDWTSLMNEALSGDHHNNTVTETSVAKETLPFSKSASDKSLNVTLHRGPEDNSCFSSPAIFPPRASYILTPAEQQQQLQDAVDAATSSSSIGLISNAATNATINLASLGLPVPSNINISVPADLQMSAENWDNLMRCLTNMATSSRHAAEVAQ